MTADLAEAIRALQRGEIIVYPTDTVYALGADIFNPLAVELVYMIKHRPMREALPVAVSSVPMMERVARVSPLARRLADQFLPGALTLVLPRHPTVPSVVTGGGRTIAVRIPKDQTSLALLEAYGPLTATSANRHHHGTPAVVPDILEDLRAPNLLALDLGVRREKPSTILDLTSSEPRILRTGGIPEAALQDVLHG